MTTKQKYTDEQIVNNLLISLKHLKSLYNTFTQEAGTPELYKEVNKLYEEISTMQRATYDLMVKEGWMQVEAQTASAIKKAADKCSQKLTEL